MPLTKDQLPYTVASAFLREGCATMGRNVCEILRLAEVPVTQGSIVDFVNNLAFHPKDLGEKEWRDACCNVCLARAFSRSGGDDSEQMRRLCDYFLTYFPNLPSTAQHMLVEAFNGILGGIKLDPAYADETQPGQRDV